MLKKTVLAVVSLLIPLAAFAAEEFVKIDTRSGVTLDLLVSAPETPNGTALILFPGGNGSDHFRVEQGVIKKGKNFLVRTVPDFTKKGFLTVVVGLPSDKPYGMDDSFRTSDKHREDIAKVVDLITGKGYTSIYLVGTSRGTISAAYLSAALKHPSIHGVVLTSTMAYSKHLQWIAIDETNYPVLLVHNKDDACKETPYHEAKDLVKRFKNSPRVDLEAVEGGLPPKSEPCNALSAHGYLGIEGKVVDIISDWVLKTSLVRKPS